MFEKIKIQLRTGNLLQYRIFNIPLFEIEKFSLQSKFKIHFCFFKNKKPHKNKPLFYLKFNATNWCNYIILQKWIDIVTEMDADYYILCDKKFACREMLNRIIFPNSDIKFLKSDKKHYKQEVKRICSKYWSNAGFSHLTTFFHAQKNNIEKFWNIDADDMIMFETPKTVAKCLSEITSYAIKEDYDMFGYDHLYSLYNHWTFGVTYIKNNSKVINQIKQTKIKNWESKYKDKVKINDCNIDWFCTYLKDTNKLKLGCFSIENMYYSHLGTPFWLLKSFYIVKDKTIIYPLHKLFVVNDKEGSEKKVNNDVKIFDFNIDENNSKEELLRYFRVGI